MRELVLITGMSGSGKSVALGALEDAGYYCIDNLPPELLLASLALERNQHIASMAIAIDARSAQSLPLLPGLLEAVRGQGVQVRVLFFDAATDTLVRRFSETRRKHPLAGGSDAHGDAALVQLIAHERSIMGPLRDMAHVIDTSHSRASELQSRLKHILGLPPGRLTLIFQSFAFKRGIPRDADYVFDVRMLPNPHYVPELKHRTGLEAPVIEFLQCEAPVQAMQQDIAGFLHKWLPSHADNHRSYVSVAIGCTGGQHRSVFMVEQLAAQFSADWTVLKRHREIELAR
ncbi:RNase adapter RapZ [Allofranklinella schreckenbergeri]|uniref:RNase adapter RapZ n=1 Tax=Allofranklinella schreckenbergeri TaxID=1076744 RepID=A0A3M6R6R8_9BURK|nr:RNase adapter RapZ [Allofranklinella schreckenbergeri]MDO4705317.1 RNase adapter RapZ [Comamonadaceae bacterium]RMX11062.1 RNase adapter RapZ [Allofranklinella schreckenbergeri]